MDWTNLSSSTLKRVKHDLSTSTLTVEFNSGATYSYAGVSAEDHAALVSASSHGSHFHQNIKGVFAHTRET